MNCIGKVLSALTSLVISSAWADAPRYGGIHFTEAVEIDGVEYPAGSTVYAQTYPTQMVVRPITGGKTFMWYESAVPRETYINKRYSEQSFYSSLNAKFPVNRISRMDGSYLMTPPGDSSVVLTNKPAYAYKVYYVATNGVDATEGGTEAEPFETIQYAVDQAYANYKFNKVLILVKPGVYNKGGYEGDANNFRSRVYVYPDQHVLIKSTDGAEKTIIEGELDPNGSEEGNGDMARRCVTFHINAGGDACIQGFTFRNGRTKTGPGQLVTNQGGGIAAQRSGHGISQHIAADCIFTNCTSGSEHTKAARVALNMWLFRCRVIGGGDSAVSSCYLSATHVDGNLGTLSWQSSGAKGFGVVTLNSVGGSQRLGPGGTYYGTVYTKNGYDGTNRGYKDATDYVANLMAGDLRPAKGGAAEFGSNVPEEGTDMWYFWTDVMAELACGDVNGNKVLWQNGVPMSGAIMESVSVRNIALTIPNTIGLDATGIVGLTLGASSVTAKIAAGYSFTLAPNTNGTHYASAVVHNGVTNYFADLPGGVYTYTVPGGEGALEFEVIRSTEWYVDDLGAAADKNKGFTREFPKGTLAGVMNVAKSGDTIYALPGTYSEGTMRNSYHVDYYMQSRVVVEKGVTLESLEGPEKTIILGSAATEDGGPVNEYGCGSNAVRCAYVRDTGKLRGFTLTGGHVNYLGGDYDDVSNGGGVRGDFGGTEPLSTVEDCIISNNCARNSGAAHWCKLVRCRILDNHITNREEAGWYNSYINCIVGNPEGTDNAKSFRFGAVVNSTFYPNASLYEHCNVNLPFANNVCMALVNDGQTPHKLTAFNCIFTSTPSVLSYAGCPVMSAAQIGLGENAVPAKDSVVVGAGSADYAAYSGDKDVYGGQRVYNGTVDIGAVEYDWRADYAGKISKETVSVTAADPQVIERDGSVTLDPGASLTANWTPTGSFACCKVTVAVTGTGTLTVTADGKVVGTVTAAESRKAFSFRGKVGEFSQIVFSYSEEVGDDGYAVIENVSSQRGMLIFVK